MAATKSQGKLVAVFLGGITAAAAGVASWESSVGKIVTIIGLALFAASFFGFLAIKKDEGKTADVPQPVVAKLFGLALAIGGWIFGLVAIHFVGAVGGRIAATLIGLAISLIGVLVVLPIAVNKHAMWKS